MVKTEDNTIEAEYNPFDAPVPGQSLTDTPGNYPWEHPPKLTDPSEVIEMLFDRLTDPESAEQIIMMLETGVPVEAIARVITFAGFTEGEFTPDVGFLIAEPVMKMITAIGMRAGVKNLRISLQDLNNRKSMREFVSLKQAQERATQVAKDIQEDVQDKIEEPKTGGLLAKPEENN